MKNLTAESAEAAEKKELRAKLAVQIEQLDRDIAGADPFAHPSRLNRGGHCICMVGQPQNCEECGAPFYRSGAYLFCEADKENHWRFVECSPEVRRAIEEHYSPSATSAVKKP